MSIFFWMEITIDRIKLLFKVHPPSAAAYKLNKVY